MKNKIDELLNDTILLKEMSLKQFNNGDELLNLIAQKKYKEAVDAYIKNGGEIGVGTSPKKTITALKRKLIASNNNMNGVTFEDLVNFEDELMARHEQMVKQQGEQGIVGKPRGRPKLVKKEANPSSPQEEQSAPAEKKERFLKKLIKKAASISFDDADSEEVKMAKQAKMLQIADRVLRIWRIVIPEANDKVLKRLPEKSSIIYPLAMAVFEYKKDYDIKKLDAVKKEIIKLQAVNSQSPEVARENAQSKVDDEIKVAFKELDKIDEANSLDELRKISKDVMSALSLTHDKKPQAKDFLDDPKYYEAILFLWMFTYDKLKTMNKQNNLDINVIKKYLKYIKRGGIGNLIVLKWAGERDENKAKNGMEADFNKYKDKLKEEQHMNIKDKILSEAYGKQNYEEAKSQEIFTSLLNGFMSDLKVFKEDTASLYSDIFGDNLSVLFEELQNNSEILTEDAINDYMNTFEKPLMKPTITQGIKNTVAPLTHGLEKFADENKLKALGNPSNISNKLGEFDKNALNNMSKVTGKGVDFLKNLFKTIKNELLTLTSKIPNAKISGALTNGINWIVANPTAILGVAGGAFLLKKIISALKKHGQAKKAAKLQAAIDAQKKASASPATA